MTVYWAMFLAACVGALIEQDDTRRKSMFADPMFMFGFLAVFIIVAFRWETGGDWINYNDMITVWFWRDIGDVFVGTDPGFGSLLYVSAKIGGGMLLVQIVTAVVILPPLFKFCASQPRPWLALAIGISYFVIVGAMGYLRQAMAISMCMLAFLALGRGSVIRYCLYVFLGALFHSSAVIMLPLGLLSVSKNRFLSIGIGTLFILVAFNALLASQVDSFVLNYEQAGISSSGGVVRILMHALPSALFLLKRKSFNLNPFENSFWTIMSILGLGLVAGVVSANSTTAVDRVGLYWLPLQMFIWSRLPTAYSTTSRGQSIIVFGIIGLYLAAFFVWLNFADNVFAWLPYRFYFFE